MAKTKATFTLTQLKALLAKYNVTYKTTRNKPKGWDDIGSTTAIFYANRNIGINALPNAKEPADIATFYQDLCMNILNDILSHDNLQDSVNDFVIQLRSLGIQYTNDYFHAIKLRIANGLTVFQKIHTLNTLRRPNPYGSPIYFKTLDELRQANHAAQLMFTTRGNRERLMRFSSDLEKKLTELSENKKIMNNPNVVFCQTADLIRMDIDGTVFHVIQIEPYDTTEPRFESSLMDVVHNAIIDTPDVFYNGTLPEPIKHLASDTIFYLKKFRNI